MFVTFGCNHRKSLEPSFILLVPLNTLKFGAKQSGNVSEEGWQNFSKPCLFGQKTQPEHFPPNQRKLRALGIEHKSPNITKVCFVGNTQKNSDYLSSRSVSD